MTKSHLQVMKMRRYRLIPKTI